MASNQDTNKRRWTERTLPLALVIALIGLFLINRFFFPCPMLPFQSSQRMMDTLVTITVYSRDEAKAQQAMDSAFARMVEVEGIASIYDDSAEAHRLNEEGRLDEPTQELWELMSLALDCTSETYGAFDITVEPLLELWKYKEGSEIQFWELDKKSQEEQLAEVLELLGQDKVSMIDNSRRSIVLAPGTRIDLGAIAKGYAVDSGLAVLKNLGIEHALIEAGGDIACYGGKPEAQEWKLALRNPDDPEDHVTSFLLSEGAVATSGNYERYFDEEAEVGHIIDPRTGYSSHASSSASVIATTCAQADALATGTFVLGPEEGIALVESLEDTEALIIGYEEPRELNRSNGLHAYEDRERIGQ